LKSLLFLIANEHFPDELRAIPLCVASGGIAPEFKPLPSRLEQYPIEASAPFIRHSNFRTVPIPTEIIKRDDFAMSSSKAIHYLLRVKRQCKINDTPSAKITMQRSGIVGSHFDP
jgi:hypothetical protein